MQRVRVGFYIVVPPMLVPILVAKLKCEREKVRGAGRGSSAKGLLCTVFRRTKRASQGWGLEDGEVCTPTPLSHAPQSPPSPPSPPPRTMLRTDIGQRQPGFPGQWGMGRGRHDKPDESLDEGDHVEAKTVAEGTHSNNGQP